MAPRAHLLHSRPSDFIVFLKGIRRHRYEQHGCLDVTSSSSIRCRANLGLDEAVHVLPCCGRSSTPILRRLRGASRSSGTATRCRERCFGFPFSPSCSRVSVRPHHPRRAGTLCCRAWRSRASIPIRFPGRSNWKARVTAGRKAGRGLGPDRYHEVRYEALIDTRTTSCPACVRSNPPARPAGRAALAGHPLVAHRYAPTPAGGVRGGRRRPAHRARVPPRGVLGRHGGAQARAAQGVFGGRPGGRGPAFRVSCDAPWGLADPLASS